MIHDLRTPQGARRAFLWIRREMVKAYFADLLDQHRRDGVVRTVAPLPLRR